MGHPPLLWPCIPSCSAVMPIVPGASLTKRRITVSVLRGPCPTGDFEIEDRVPGTMHHHRTKRRLIGRAVVASCCHHSSLTSLFVGGSPTTGVGYGTTALHTYCGGVKRTAHLFRGSTALRFLVMLLYSFCCCINAPVDGRIECFCRYEQACSARCSGQNTRQSFHFFRVFFFIMR